jgi:hypothetical protein
MGYESKIMVVENYSGDTEYGYRHIVAEVNMSGVAELILQAFDTPTNRAYHLTESGWTISDGVSVDEFGSTTVLEDRYGDCFNKCSNPLGLLNELLKVPHYKHNNIANNNHLRMLIAMIQAYADAFEAGYYELIHYGY